MDNVDIIIGIILLAIIIIFTPILAIWAVNTLFDTTVEVTLLNWFAALLLLSFMGGSRSTERSN